MNAQRREVKLLEQEKFIVCVVPKREFKEFQAKTSLIKLRNEENMFISGRSCESSSLLDCKVDLNIRIEVKHIILTPNTCAVCDIQNYTKFLLMLAGWLMR